MINGLQIAIGHLVFTLYRKFTLWEIEGLKKFVLRNDKLKRNKMCAKEFEKLVWFICGHNNTKALKINKRKQTLLLKA